MQRALMNAATRVLLFVSCVLLMTLTAKADAIYNVSLNTSSLAGTGQYYVNFQLVQGAAITSNTATLSAFNFGAGSAVGAPLPDPDTTSGAAGSLTDQVTITTSDFFNQFTQEFNPGNTLSFVLGLTQESAGETPDQFSFGLLYDDGTGSLVNIPTTDPGNAFFTVDINPRLVVNTFGTDPGQTRFSLSAPTLTAVPEPTTTLLLSSGLGVMALKLRRRRANAAKPSLLRRLPGQGW